MVRNGAVIEPSSLSEGFESVSEDGSMTGDTKRQAMLNLLAGERQKRKDASDQI